MRAEIKDSELEQVSGGTVVFSKDYNMVGFSTMNTSFPLKNCTYREAANYVEDLLDENKGMSNAEFDAFAKKMLKAKGWI